MDVGGRRGGGSKVFASLLDTWCCTDWVGKAVKGVGVGEDGEFRISVVMCCVLRVLSSGPGPWQGTEACKEGWTLTCCGALPGCSYILGSTQWTTCVWYGAGAGTLVQEAGSVRRPWQPQSSAAEVSFQGSGTARSSSDSAAKDLRTEKGSGPGCFAVVPPSPFLSPPQPGSRRQKKRLPFCSCGAGTLARDRLLA